MYKAKVYAVGTELEFEETSLKEMWKRLAFFQSLPDTCPIDDTPTRLFYKEPEGNSYFSVVNTGQLHFEYKLGQYKEAKDDLFGKGEWWWWDWQNKEDILLCKWGELTPEGETMRERCLNGGMSAPVAHKGAQATYPDAGQRFQAQKHYDSKESEKYTPLTDDVPFMDSGDSSADIPFDDNPFNGPSYDKLMHALGTALYGKGWNQQRHKVLKRDFQVESSNDLSPQQMSQFVDNLCTIARTGIEKNLSAFSAGELDHLLAEGNNGNKTTLPKAGAMALAHVVKALQAKRQPA